MAARIARVCDGHPIFLAARSPSRADWIDVLRRSKNWLGLEASWESLCTPAPLYGHPRDGLSKSKENADDKRERTDQEAVMAAFSNEGVFDERTFRASAKAKELRAAREEEEEQRKEYCRTPSIPYANKKGHHIDCAPTDSSPQQHPKHCAHEDGKEYPITMERAELIVRWIMEAQPPSSADGNGRPKKRATPKGRLRKMASTAPSLSRDSRGENNIDHLKRGVDGLDLLD